jgi:DNA polymerase IV
MGQGPSPLIHVDLGSFFVAVERRRRPELAARPVVIGGRPGSRGAVAAASREARRSGVQPGMPLSEAAMRCPDAVFIDGAFDLYFAAAMEIDAVIRRESSEIEWRSIDELFVAFPSSRSTRDVVAAAERIRHEVEALGFDAACGVARTKLVASIASQLTRPRGVLHVLDGYEARFLAPLKIELLPGLDPAVARRLRGAGIRRLGQVARLDEQQALRIAGRGGAALAKRATGMDTSRVRRTALPPPRIQDVRLASPSKDANEIRAAVRAQVERAGCDLRARGLFARTLTLRLRFADGRNESRTGMLPEPSALDDALFAVALELLSRIWTGERLVSAVSVSCAGLLAGSADAALFPLAPRRSA